MEVPAELPNPDDPAVSVSSAVKFSDITYEDGFTETGLERRVSFTLHENDVDVQNGASSDSILLVVCRFH